jgi:hypothetical protein
MSGEIDVWQRLEICSKETCAKYDKLKADVKVQTEKNLLKIKPLMRKDFKKWNALADKILIEEHEKLHKRYLCIAKSCSNEFKDFVTRDIKGLQKSLKELEQEVSTQAVNKTASKARQSLIKKLKNDIKLLNDILTTDIATANTAVIGMLLRHF